jgi:hypothetical protein
VEEKRTGLREEVEKNLKRRERGMFRGVRFCERIAVRFSLRFPAQGGLKFNFG